MCENVVSAVDGEKSENLGQVFTSDIVARLMVELIKPHLDDDSECLDPCIGKNVFFSHMEDITVGRLVGIEADKSLISSDIEEFYSKKNRYLYVKNFFDFSLDEKFDAIIMNPPYVRQEKINGSINSKKKLERQFEFYGYKIPKKSNLYVYFFLKALKHLKSGGKLVAITYDSWLFTRFGKSFKKYLAESYNVEKIIHFRKGAFDNVDIGATIILLSNENQQPKIEYYSYESPEQLSKGNRILLEGHKRITIDEFLSFNKRFPSDIDFSSDLFTTMSRISERRITRGTNAIVNKFFLFEKEKFPGHMTKLIKDVTKIKKFVISDEWVYLLNVNVQEMDKNVEDYLQRIRSEVINSPTRYRSLAERIRQEDLWYIPKLKEPGNFIFNYYMRDNIHFIYNPLMINSSDNFYNMYIKDHVLGNLCILNSGFTRYALMRYGRMQGKGLFKIQLYEFNEVPVIDINKLSPEAIVSLEKLGERLLYTDRRHPDDIIKHIDDILVKEYNRKTKNNMTTKKLYQLIKKIREGDY